MFPILPVPDFLIELVPELTTSFASWWGFGICVVVGLVSMVFGLYEYSKTTKPKSEAMTQIYKGWSLFGLGVLFLLVSPYLWALLILAIGFFLIVVVGIAFIITIREFGA